ncbi:MAG: universal stress protein [Deltaproteobacteria bacterium]|nr:universal stress protein [Deltaproteobacteria bacterium]
MEKNVDVSQKGRRRLKVLVAIEESEISDLVLKRSGQFAKATDCELTILTVMEDVVRYPEFSDTVLSSLQQKQKEKCQEILDHARSLLNRYGIDCSTSLATGHVEDEILRRAEEGQFDVIFIGNRGRGRFKRMLLGSTADAVIRHAHCPVTVIR